MTTIAQLNFVPETYQLLLAHLLANGSGCEEAAFGFAKTNGDDSRLVFDLFELLPVPEDGFVAQSPVFLQLTDEMRAKVIKRAHDLRMSLIEFHSHPFQRAAEFSPSDLYGFQEFVPHVKWRLKGRPYAAFVFARGSFDALAWPGAVEFPIAFTAITTDDLALSPTGLSMANWSKPYHEHQSL